MIERECERERGKYAWLGGKKSEFVRKNCRNAGVGN